MTSERLRALGRFARAHIPELIVVAFGLGLRISLTKTFDVTLGYDYPAHLQFAKYIQEHWRIPPYTLNFSAYNPSLFYWLAAFLMKLGCSVQAVGRAGDHLRLSAAGRDVDRRWRCTCVNRAWPVCWLS